MSVWLKALLIALAFGSANAADKIYKWVDEKGVVHYSRTPPPEKADDAKIAIEDENDFKEDDPRSRAYSNGFWSGEHNGQPVLLMLDKKGWFSISLLRDKSRNRGNIALKGVYAGSFKAKHKKLSFDVWHTYPKQKDSLSYPRSAIVVEASWDRLVLEWNELGKVEYRRRNDVNNGRTYKPAVLDRIK